MEEKGTSLILGEFPSWRRRNICTWGWMMSYGYRSPVSSKWLGQKVIAPAREEQGWGKAETSLSTKIIQNLWLREDGPEPRLKEWVRFRKGKRSKKGMNKGEGQILSGHWDDHMDSVREREQRNSGRQIARLFETSLKNFSFMSDTKVTRVLNKTLTWLKQ